MTINIKIRKATILVKTESGGFNHSDQNENFVFDWSDAELASFINDKLSNLGINTKVTKDDIPTHPDVELQTKIQNANNLSELKWVLADSQHGASSRRGSQAGQSEQF